MAKGTATFRSSIFIGDIVVETARVEGIQQFGLGLGPPGVVQASVST
ncbi:hypothetical protein SPB21_14630 [Leptothoe sp. ISB3NOV94-8A]|nr:hypothetical protein [Adonisia turfae]MDV3352987.1 hypothetical protein [Leptothoe sp. LEGE 181152]